jgi:hypothetical protein
MTKLSEALKANNPALIKLRLGESVAEYKKTIGSYFNITSVGTVAALGVIGSLVMQDIKKNPSAIATSLAVEAGVWGVGRLGYECYQQCRNYHDANIGKNFTKSMEELKKEETNNFGFYSDALKMLSGIEEEIIAEGNKVFPNLETMEQKLLASKILREEIFATRENRSAVLAKSNELLKSFAAWKEIQRDREFPGVAQMVTGMMATMIPALKIADSLGQESSAFVKAAAIIMSPIVASVLPNVGPKMSFETGLKGDPIPAIVPLKEQSRVVSRFKTFAEVVPPYFKAYEVTDKKTQVTLILSMESLMKDRYPTAKSIPIQPNGVDLILEILDGHNKSKELKSQVIVTEKSKIELAETAKAKVVDLEVPEVEEQDLDNKPISRSSSEEALTEEGKKDSLDQKMQRERLRVERSELVEMVDAARREKAAALKKAQNEAAGIQFKNTGVKTKTGADQKDVHEESKEFVAGLRDKLIPTGKDVTGKIGKQF